MNASIKNVPFVSNAPDGLHCHQSCIRMAIGYFEGSIPDLETIDAMTGFIPTKLTWHMKSFVEMHKRGYDVRVIESTDFSKLANDPDKYIAEVHGAEIAEIIRRDSDLGQARYWSKELIRSPIKRECRVPQLSDLCNFLNAGFVCICHVNQRMLQGSEGYIGHSVVPVSIDEQYVVIKNPGPPSADNQYLSIDQFISAWSSPDIDARTIMAVRLK